jgi:hypothetical protein
MSILDMFSKKEEPKKEQDWLDKQADELTEAFNDPQLTEEERKHQELLAKRLEELRKRDPFIYK